MRRRASTITRYTNLCKIAKEGWGTFSKGHPLITTRLEVEEGIRKSRTKGEEEVSEIPNFCVTFLIDAP